MYRIIMLSEKSEVKSLSCVRLFATPWTVAYQAPPSMGFSRQEYWSGVPLPSPGDLPNLGIELGSPAFQADALTTEPPGKNRIHLHLINYLSCHLVLKFLVLTWPSFCLDFRMPSAEMGWFILQYMRIVSIVLKIMGNGIWRAPFFTLKRFTLLIM